MNDDIVKIVYDLVRHEPIGFSLFECAVNFLFLLDVVVLFSDVNKEEMKGKCIFSHIRNHDSDRFLFMKRTRSHVTINSKMNQSHFVFV
jgi:hypothetical protein